MNEQIEIAKAIIDHEEAIAQAKSIGLEWFADLLSRDLNALLRERGTSRTNEIQNDVKLNG